MSLICSIKFKPIHMRKKLLHSLELEFDFLMLDWTKEEVEKYLKKLWVEDHNIEEVFVWCTFETWDLVIIWVKNKDYNTIIHEVTHAIIKVFLWKDTEYCNEKTQEIFANYVWFYWEKAIEFYKKRN
jgi:hypothetical protein